MRFVKSIILMIILFGLTAFNQTSTGHDVIFYIPHQDDETLTFGSSIHYHIQSGHNVQVVLLTDGSSTVVGKRLGLDEETLVNARNKEFLLALSHLGVARENIHKMGFKDGSLTIEQAKKVMKKFSKKYPNASHKTYTYTDWHQDHRNAGFALKELAQKEKIHNTAYFIRRGEKPENKKLYASAYEVDAYPDLLAASRSYNVIDYKNGMYGMCWKSVPKSFQAMEKDPKNYYHR